MPNERKQAEPEQEAGAPEWMVTFSDCMTLLLTFFVLLLSFSSFSDQDDFKRMSSSFAENLSFGKDPLNDREAMTMLSRPRDDQELKWGSEKPTQAEGDEDRFKRGTQPSDILRLRTFLASSGNIFFGQGSKLSQNGQKTLSDLASLLKRLPNETVIISESGPEMSQDPRDVGFKRAWAVCDYLIDKGDIQPDRVSISAVGTAAKEYHSSRRAQRDAAGADRVLEIVLLRRRL